MEKSLLLIKELFEFHPTSELAIRDMEAVRMRLAEIAKDVLAAAGPSSHTTVALRSLQHAMMDCNVAIVHGRTNNVLTPPDNSE